MLDLLNDAVNYYYSKSEEIEGYLRSRGIENNDSFKFGYADGGLSNFLQQKGYSREVLISSGLIYEDSLMDVFYKGVVIPYFEKGQPITMRFRSLEEKAKARYRSLSSNSPFYKTMFYNNDELLVSDSEKATRSLFIFEGEFDTVTGMMMGLHCVGLPGLQAVPANMDSVALFKNVYLAFDADAPGDASSLFQVYKLSRVCRRLSFPKGYDMNMFVREFGKEAFNDLIIDSEDLEPSWAQTELEGTEEYVVSFQSENAVIGLVLRSPSLMRRVIDILSLRKKEDLDKYFYHSRNNRVVKIIFEMYLKGIPIDIINVVEMSGIVSSKVKEYLELDVRPDNLKSYCKNLIRANLYRLSLDKAKLVLGTVRGKSKDIFSLLPVLDDWSDILSGAREGHRMLYYGDSLVKERVEGLYHRTTLKKIGTGYKEWDKVLSMGFVVRGEISILAGRPVEGKSSVKANLIVNLCEAGCCVVSVSPEQGLMMEHDRLDAILTKRSISDFYDIDLLKSNPEVIESLRKQANHIKDRWDYYLLPQRGLYFNAFASYLERINRYQQIDVVFVDLFDRFQDIVDAGSQMKFVMEGLLNECNVLARKYNCHICLLHPIRRMTGADKRPHDRPTLNDLKDSGRLEQDSYAVYLVYRRALHFKDEYDDTISIIIAKQKQGACGDNVEIKLGWDKETLSIYDYEEGD
ncbi:MAG: DnaB-like helicase C-terminal domain-containing protein [Candidatus Heimdallarchaeaceae archaeon]